MSHLVFASVPGLRAEDLSRMPNLSKLFANGAQRSVSHAFPAVTWPSQANMLTGQLPNEHGVVANGFYWREQNKVEMWTAWNEVIEAPQIWDTLSAKEISSAAWFPMLSKGCGADFVCMPAPIHQPDGSEEMWCYSKPQSFYGTLLEQLGHFPLKHFWGPLANIESSKWIAESAAIAAGEFQPRFFYLYLPHLDYAAQKFGPNSPQALAAVAELDELVGVLVDRFSSAYSQPVDWMFVSEYVITPVDHVTYPNRVLRDAGLLQVAQRDGEEHLDLDNSDAWALVDHQFAHVFVKDANSETIQAVANLFENVEGIERVLTGADRGSLDHARSGDVILCSTANSWQAYYWWTDDARAPAFARTVDIHQKPGYDPVELFFDFEKREVPMDATLIRGSHGYDWAGSSGGTGGGVLLTTFESNNDRGDEGSENLTVADTDVYGLVMEYFGLK